MSTSALFPNSYSHWLRDRLPGARMETLATCGSCAMEKPFGLTRDPGPFDPGLKCCTYFPFIPNFGLGAILKSTSPSSPRIQVAARSGLLLPLGLFASPERETTFKQSKFGQDREFLCPFFDTALKGCSIWSHRPAVCASYFCKSDEGEEGLNFWSDVESYLNHFEWTVANEALWRLGFTQDEIRLCDHPSLTEEPGEERDFLVRRAWAEWADRRSDLLIRCYERALEITPAELSKLLGDETLQLEESLRVRVP